MPSSGHIRSGVRILRDSVVLPTALQTPPGQPGGTGTVDFLLAYT
ncbi:hypothetical protein [Micromonospora sp. NPDC005197]